jgi:ADP-ribose pyrophosphatase YjhB (NUDIX family)
MTDLDAEGTTTKGTGSLKTRTRAYFYGVFYRLPGHWRRRLVRLATSKFTVGAVVLVRDADDPGRMLLLRQPPGYGWSLPAGLLKKGERPAVGAARELFEESGVRVAAEDLEPGTPNAVIHSAGRWVDVVFQARVPRDVPLVADGGEVLEVAWHRLDALPPLTVPTAKLLAHYDIGPYTEYPEVRTGD